MFHFSSLPHVNDCFLLTSVSLYLFVTTFFYAFLYKVFGFLCFCLLSRFVNDDIAFVKLVLFLYVSLLFLCISLQSFWIFVFLLVVQVC